MAQRTKAREVVLQMLYQMDLNPEVAVEDVRTQIDEQLESKSLADFAWMLFARVMENRSQIDSQIEQAADNWRLSRMAPTDRNAIRQGAFELQFTDTNHRVVIDEMVELAKLFGGPNSSAFVNGVLDQLVPEGKRQTTSDESTQADSD